MQKVYLASSFSKCNENCGLPDFLTDYQIRHLSNPSGLPEILPKIDPCIYVYPIYVLSVVFVIVIVNITELNRLPVVGFYCLFI